MLIYGALLAIALGSLVEPSASSGRIFRDPASGRFGPPTATSPHSRATRTLSEALSTSHRGLKQSAITAKPGGFSVNLGGRFRTAMVAKRSTSGEVILACALPPAEVREDHTERLPIESEERP